MKVATKKIGTKIYHGDAFRSETSGLVVISSLSVSRSGSFSSETLAFETMIRLLMSCERERRKKSRAKEKSKIRNLPHKHTKETKLPFPDLRSSSRRILRARDRHHHSSVILERCLNGAYR
jgi:hypothetical protein